MIVFFISCIVILIISIGYGSLVKFLLIKNNIINTLSFGETGVVGFYFILLISLLIHFFVPLNIFINSFIFFFALFPLFFFRRNIKILIPKKILSIFIILILPLMFSIEGHPDFEWYHFPYINYLSNFKIIFGLANANDFLGYPNTWNDISGIFFPMISGKGNNLISIFFSMYVIIFFLEEIYLSKKTESKIFLIFILIFCITKYTEGNEYGGHTPPTFLGFLINYYFFKMFLKLNFDKKEIIFKILLFFSFALLLRINFIVLFPIIIYLFIFYYKEVLNILLNKKIIFFIILIPSIFLTKNFIITGCLIYPISQTCFSSEDVSWSVGKNYADERYSHIKASTRGWNDYVLIDGKINDRIDYLIPLEKKLILSTSNYLKQGFLFWFKYWVQSGDVKKIINSFLIISLLALLLFLFSKKKKDFLENYLKFKYLFIVFFSQVLIWLYLTPQTLYGGNLVITSLLVFLVTYILKNIDLNSFSTKFCIFFLFFISLSYFEYKNISRIYNEYLNNENYFESFPLIKINQNLLDKDYYELKINQFKINVKKKIPGRRAELPDPCGSTPMICLPEDRKNCIDNIYKKKSYLYIKGNEQYCIDHIKKRIFY